ncbi:protein FAR1-RELATED SEQUENCE 5-like [Mercurialis annua]|uniref:protein FAR1-RELATED SEQUENCE 5-like n=1 Tax=Mercurialis annua TaxID=3986 RepID=UPI0024AFCCCB|nr:protein FAR1-RELATED SEQUENCE 5-like [Mercurialis annua]
MEFDTIEDAWQFWMAYGARNGFDSRKQWFNKNKKDGKISSARFVCNKEGSRREDKRDNLTKHPRAETRTNCPARVGITFVKESEKYKIHDLVVDHNHYLHLSETAHMMSSQRKISKAQAFEIDLADASGIKTKSSYELMSRHNGGKSSVGYILLDQKNYLRRKRQRDLMYGEAGSLLRYFQQQSLDNPSFFYAVQLDEDEQITNIFWADARMIIDYAHFGDVITFDTTYSTNKEFRPLGVFIGFNHHREITIFGAALLYDETCESFAWLFRTFLEAHKQKKPKTIFTDQDLAMASALTEIMPETYHGLCTWHIMQNAVKNLGNLLKDGSNLLKDLKACIYAYDEEVTFQAAWEGVRSTQLSESLNGDLKDYLKSDLDISQFFKHFERVLEDKRYNELKAEYSSREKLPKLRMQKSPLLQQAAKIYTPPIFELFQNEYDWSLAAFIKSRQEIQESYEYSVAIFDREGVYNVKGVPSAETVTCSCKKFETFGILCCHALKVLDVMDIKLIPDHYIVKRWTRKAKSENVENVSGKIVHEDVKLVVTQRYRYLCSKLVKLASAASEFEDTYKLIDEAIDELNKQITAMGSKFSNCSEDNQKTCSSLSEKRVEVENLIKNVKGLKKRTGRKGRKRLKSSVETQHNKKTKKTKKDHHKNEIKKNSDNFSLLPQSSNYMNNSSQNTFDQFYVAVMGGSQVLPMDSIQSLHKSNIV